MAYPFPGSGAPVLAELQGSRRGKREANCDFRTTWVSLLGSNQDGKNLETMGIGSFPFLETPQVIERRELGCPKTQAETEQEVSDKGKCSELSTGQKEMGIFVSTGFRGFQNE